MNDTAAQPPPPNGALGILRLGRAAVALLPLGVWAVLGGLVGKELQHPFTFFLLPVLLASQWGGLYVGLAATLLAGLAAWDFATPATPLFDLTSGGQSVDVLGLIVFLVTGLMLVFTQEAMRQRLAQMLATERAADEHKKSLESRDDIFNETNDLIQSVAPDGGILYANRSWCETLGYTRDELPSLNIFQIIHPDCRDHCMAAFGRLMQGEEIGLIEVTFAAKDGRKIQLEGNVSARTENGGMVSTRGIFRDITARQQAEAALRRSEEEFRTVVESSPNGIVLADSQGIITLVNAQLEHDTGYARGELVGQPVEKLVPGRHAGEHPVHRLRYAANPEARSMGAGRDLSVRRKDGSEFPAEIGLAPILTAAGKMTLASVVDLTARKQAEGALKESMEKLICSNTELEQFAYVASHDLQEPLRAISGCVQILERGYREKLDARAGELIHHTVEGVARMQNLINDLLAYSRAVKQQMARAPVSLQSVIAEAQLNLDTAITKSGAVITCGDLPTVAVDATQVTQLFQNLLGNAIKFRGLKTPAIHVSAERQSAGWKIAVRDNGIGIEPQYFDRIFTLFQRLHTRGEYPGTGLGLSICQKIVEAHSGRIWLESTPGQGTTFFFTLPSL